VGEELGRFGQVVERRKEADVTAKQRAWWGYAAAWIPIALIYTVVAITPHPIYQRPVPPLIVAIIEGISYVAPVALMGVVVWRFTGMLTWPPRSLWRFLITHVVAAIAFSSAWLASQWALIGASVGLHMATEIVKGFAGFQIIEGIFVYGLVAAGSHAIRIATRLREQEARVARADALRMRAELAALRGQLNPHFLFNTLHTLTALVRRDPGTAENALERFGDMLRYVLDVKRSQREDVTLADEMQFVRNYLALEHLRLGERLRIVEHIDPDALDCVVPSLTLQPLVENAIKYAIAPRSQGGTIEIVATLVGDALQLEVRDDGPGAASDIMTSAAGVGLRAVRQRLETRFPGRSEFDVVTAPAQGFVARVALPADPSHHAVPAGLA
jgi:signal transduction histidine kinase